MIACPSCGAENVEGTRFCVKCGTTLPASPAPEAWRQSGDLGQQQTQQPGYQSGGYTPPEPQQPGYPTYNQQQQMYPQPQPQPQPALGGPGQMHPAVPAVVSLFLPGIGLLFVPNKAGLGIGIFAATIVYAIIATILTFVVVGVCLFAVMPLINVAAAVHSWDEAAKASNGQFQPILFK